MVSTILYRIGWAFYWIIYTIIWRRKVTGLENLPENTGYIIAANHKSFADPPLVGSSIIKPVHFMAKKELFSIPVFGWILKKVNAFPVDRSGSDQKAVRTAIKLLSSGKILLLFPQGGRRKDSGSEEYTKFRGGAGLLACWAKVPVVPCKIENSDKLFQLKKLKVTFFEPVYPPAGKPRQEDYERITAEVMLKILQTTDKHG